MKYKKLLISLAICSYALAVPILELNETHLYNPDWTPHARIHELWQLISNSCLGLLSLYLVWFKNQIRLPSILGLIVTGGFLTAYLFRSLYGGSMAFLDGSESLVFGLNIGLLGFGIAFIIFIFCVGRQEKILFKD